MPNFNYRVLVVDDDRNILTASQAVLATRGYETRGVQDGFEALAIMRKALPDLIICDLSMPRMSGFEFLSIVRRRFPQIPVIATSGDFSGPDVPNWLLADAFIPKAINPEDTLRRIAELLEASPLRATPAKADKAPVWIPKYGDYFVLTCPECLRSFSLPDEELTETGLRQHNCIACNIQFQFVLEGRSRK
jgi:CheY-like chemotaxis protein